MQGAVELSTPDMNHLQAAEGWLELGNWSEANEELEEITPNLRAHPLVLVLRVRIYAAAGRWETALQLGGWLAVSPVADAELLLALSLSACQTGDLDRARAWVTRAVELNQTAEFKLRLLDDPLFTSLLKPPCPDC
jgi:uncharacterized protein HemY